MCKSTFSQGSNEELILELHKRGLLTEAKSNSVIIKELNENSKISVILTKGLPLENMECRECRKSLDSFHFRYYLSRVDQNGFLMRSNALCDNCAKNSNKQRKKVLDNSQIPLKPKKGSECPHCERPWKGNWHRHHEGDKFIEWLCGHCNMSFSDQRNNK